MKPYFLKEFQIKVIRQKSIIFVHLWQIHAIIPERYLSYTCTGINDTAKTIYFERMRYDSDTKIWCETIIKKHFLQKLEDQREPSHQISVLQAHHLRSLHHQWRNSRHYYCLIYSIRICLCWLDAGEQPLNQQ